MWEGDDPADEWPSWANAEETGGADERSSAAEVAEIIPDPAPTASAGIATTDDACAALLRTLRALPGPCAPPVGEGAFDILYASAREIVVWFVSAKEGASQREVAIPTRLARDAWEIIRRGEPVDEAALRALADGAAGGRWLLALFAQLPGVEVRNTSANADGASDDASVIVTLHWRGEAAG